MLVNADDEQEKRRVWDLGRFLCSLLVFEDIVCAESCGSYCKSILEKDCPLVWAFGKRG